MKTRTIKQKITFTASVHDVFEALMDAKKHAAFTGGDAAISRKIGGSFSVYDGYATGKNLELIKDKKIIQSWRASDWETGLFSKVSFILTRSDTGCRLEFIHSDVPSEQYSSIKQGWRDFYWKPMKEIFKND